MKDQRPIGRGAKLFYARTRYSGRAVDLFPLSRTKGHFQSSYSKNRSYDPVLRAVPWMISADQQQVLYIGPVSQLTEIFLVDSAHLSAEQNRNTLGLHEQLRKLIQRHASEISENSERLSTEYHFAQPGSLLSTIKLSSWPVRDDRDIILFRAGIAIATPNQAIGSSAP